MQREERIARARQAARERAPEITREKEAREALVRDRLAAAGPDEAQRLVSAAERAGDARFLGPDKTPAEWREAVAIARKTAIDAARRGVTITYGEIKFAIWQTLGMLVGYSMFAELAMGVNRRDDGVLLSSIIVHRDDRRPGAGFFPYARRQGFDAPLAALQRGVFEHFGNSGPSSRAPTSSPTDSA